MLKVEEHGAVLRVTLNRPEVRNALDDKLISALSETFSSLKSSVRVVVLAGEGAAFCAGADLKWMTRTTQYSLEQNEEDALKVALMYQAIVRCHPVVIAKVHGPAFGGGAGLVAASDIAVATTDTKFAFSEVRIGMVPATISPIVLPKIGASHARALFVTGEVFSAERAEKIGLVHHVAKPEDLEAVVEEKIRAVLSSGPRAVAESKRVAAQPPLSAEDAARLLAAVRAGSEAHEGFNAFLEKRPAAFVVEP